MYGKPFLTYFNYQVYLFGSRAIICLIEYRAKGGEFFFPYLYFGTSFALATYENFWTHLLMDW